MKAPAGLSSAVGALAATLLATSVAAALLDILGLVVPGSAEGYVIPLCFGAALVGGIITRAARAHDALSGAWLRQRLPEILGLALVARLAGWLWHLATNPAAEAGLDAFASWGEAWRWVGGGHVGVAVLCALAAWYSAGMLASALQTLEPNAETLALEHESGVNTDRSATRDRLVDTLLALGVVVTGLTTLARLASGGAINNVWRIVLYFALTFVLLAQSRFALLRAQWARAGMSVRPGLAGRWAAIALVLLVALGIGVLPLSTRYARDLLLAANWVLNLLLFVIGLVGWLFVAALSALVSAIAALLLPGGGRGTPPVGPPPVFPAAEAARTANMPLDLRPIAFVVLIGGSLLFVLHRLWTARKEIMRFAGRSRAGLRLLTALRAVRRALRGGVTRARAWAAEFQARRALAGLARRAEGMRALRVQGPRERVFFYYRALLRRAGERGHPRGIGQTPAEYAVRLRATLPAPEAPALDALTDAFQQARYAAPEVDAPTVSRARAAWEVLRRALSAKMRS